MAFSVGSVSLELNGVGAGASGESGDCWYDGYATTGAADASVPLKISRATMPTPSARRVTNERIDLACGLNARFSVCDMNVVNCEVEATGPCGHGAKASDDVIDEIVHIRWQFRHVNTRYIF